MAGFVFNILSEQSSGSPANSQLKTGDLSQLSQFKQVLQQASLESSELTRSSLANQADIKSGKNLPINLSFYEQSFAGDAVIKDDSKQSDRTVLAIENKVNHETNILTDVVASQLDVDLNSELNATKPDARLDIKLNTDSSVSNDAQVNPNSLLDLAVIPGVESINPLKPVSNEIVVDGPFTKHINISQKGVSGGVSLGGQTVQSKTLEQLNPSDHDIEPAKPAHKPTLVESVRLSLADQQTKPVVEGDLQDRKLQELKVFEAMKNGNLIDGEDALETLKPESLKIERFISKLDQKDITPKTDVTQMATRLKNSMLTQNTNSTLNNSAQGFSISEVDSSSPINRLTIAANSELTTHSVKQPANMMANSEIQSGLSLKRSFTPNLAARIQWVYQQAISSAEILMDPPELGPLSVKLTNSNGETNVLFQVSNSATKDAIEENLAKLKELLSEQGINLGDTQVEQQNKNEENENSNEQIASDSGLDSEQQNEQQTVQLKQGLLDTYI